MSAASSVNHAASPAVEPTVPVIAGNDGLLQELRLMKRNGHLPHALLLVGEAGCGKKRIAHWFTMLVLCEHPEQAPCGNCRSCQLIAEQAHPDICYAEHSGKRKGYSVETVRNIRAEASILPNNGSMRMFLFPDADGMSVQAQNALLKSVEEPPAHACFVFTAETAGVLLPTLRSRMTTKAVFPVTRGECVEALLRRSFAQADVQAAVSRFDGNIGKCIAFLEDDALRRAADRAAALTNAFAHRDEYRMLCCLTEAASEKDTLRRMLQLFDAQVRDASVMTLSGAFDRIGCDRDSAEQLSAEMTPQRMARMHGAVLEAIADLDGNVGATLTVTALCAALVRG